MAFVSRLKSVYSAPQAFWVDYLKNILESEGIECFVKNQYLLGAAGELPPNECWPSLHVFNDADYPRAKQLVESELKMQNNQSNAQDWLCGGCGEHVEQPFGVCWRCGALRSECE